MVSDQAAVETANSIFPIAIFGRQSTAAPAICLLQAGDLVKANDTTALVNINQLQPVYITFSAPEQLLPEIRRYSPDVRFRLPAPVLPMAQTAL